MDDSDWQGVDKTVDDPEEARVMFCALDSFLSVHVSWFCPSSTEFATISFSSSFWGAAELFARLQFALLASQSCINLEDEKSCTLLRLFLLVLFYTSLKTC